MFYEIASAIILFILVALAIIFIPYVISRVASVAHYRTKEEYEERRRRRQKYFIPEAKDQPKKEN